MHLLWIVVFHWMLFPFLEQPGESIEKAGIPLHQPASSQKKDISGRKEDRPNFVIILTDDQGYQDVGKYGSPNI
jgi:hypothetical protein